MPRLKKVQAVFIIIIKREMMIMFKSFPKNFFAGFDNTPASFCGRGSSETRIEGSFIMIREKIIKAAISSRKKTCNIVIPPSDANGKTDDEQKFR